MILSVQNIEKTFPGQPLFTGASFILEDHEKAAIVGINGSGKTTLLKMITGEVSSDGGIVILSKDKTMGYLAQENEEDPTLTIYDLMLRARPDVVELEQKLQEMGDRIHALQETVAPDDPSLSELVEQYTKMQTDFEHKDGYSYKSLLTGMLKGLGFTEEEFGKKVSTLSGGQKTRAHLARLLFQSPDLIILDEPTNHLDIASIEWLEGFLKNYKGAVLLISHDRYFLDNIVTKVIAIEERSLRTYQGNYSAYANKAAALFEARLNAYYKQAEVIAHQEAVIAKLKSFNREKSIKRAESREKLLGKMERLEKPEALRDKMHLSLMPDKESGKDVLICEELAKSFGHQTLFTDVSLLIKRQERVAVIGANGTGKTTLLKLITGLETPDAGQVTFGSNVVVGYYDQEHGGLDSDKTLFDEISDTYPRLDQTKIRNTLAAFLFTGDDVYKKVGSLSGGEKGRLSLAKLMLSGANFLILDEPTNHLDIASKEILEEALNDYDGTVLYVSHDRYFVNRTATRILDLCGQHFYEFGGNYDYYLEKRADVERDALVMQGASPLAATGTAGPLQVAGASSPASAGNADGGSSAGNDPGAKEDWKTQKARQAQERKKENRIKKCEEEIAALEEKNSDIQSQLSDPKNGTDLPLLQKLSKEQEEITEKLDDLYSLWDELMS